jgi:asparagine synthase (glutamine-hydrolysing)
MSVQLGRLNLDQRPTDREFIDQAAKLTAKYAREVGTVLTLGPLTMSFQPFHCVEEQAHEKQPVVSPRGPILTWDGRLDNREELFQLLGCAQATQPDAEIVLAAYHRWGDGCFSRLAGDWALCIWDNTKKTLFLARDFIGARQLFYTADSRAVTWCTVLDPLVQLSVHRLEISEEFIAGYLSTYPDTGLTPFTGIHAVAAGTFITITKSRTSVHRHWQLNPDHHVCCRSDTEYEDGFRHFFRQAVRRRLRSRFPILAELSGGMDSTSIVCVADQLLSERKAITSRVDTISYYDDEEPNWNERPFFSLVENKRGRVGYHLDVGSSAGAFVRPEGNLFWAFPGPDARDLARSVEFGRCLERCQARVLLSGIGGDEFVGGVPTAVPELQTLFTDLRWVRFARQLSRFCLEQRRPILHLAWQTLEEFLPQQVRRLYRSPYIAPWLRPSFVQRHRDVFWADTRRVKLGCATPSFQSNLNGLDHVRRQLSTLHLNEFSNCRVTYPFLDRDLLSFLVAVPREQLVRPGQRRSLLRRALKDSVPREILDRKRKASVARRPLTILAGADAAIAALLQSPLIVSEGWIDKQVLRKAILEAKRGRSEHMISLQATLRLELWLQTLRQHPVPCAAASGSQLALSSRRQEPLGQARGALHRKDSTFQG